MQTWMRIAGIVLLLTGCSLQMEAPRESVALFEARPAVPSPGDLVPVPIEDPLVIPSADFEKMQAYPYVCMQVIGADGKFGTPLQEMGSEGSAPYITGLFAKFSIPKLWVGRKYSIRVFGFKSRMEVCPFDFKGVSDFAQLGVLDNFVVPDKPSEVRIPVNFWESSAMPPNPPPPSETPVFTITGFTPNLLNLTFGQSGTLVVVANVNPFAPLSYDWYSATGSVGSCSSGTFFANTTNPTLTIGPFSTSETKYFCVIVKAPGAIPVPSAWAQVNVNPSGPPPNTQEVNFLTPPAVATGSGITVSWSPLPMGCQTVVSWVQGNDQNMNEPIGCSAGNFTSAISSHFHTPVEPGKWYRYRICTQNGTTVSPGVVTPAVQAIFPTNLCTGDLYSNPVSPGTVCLGPESQQIEFVATNTGFPIWREQAGQRRILNATGIVGNGWQKKFNSNEDLIDMAVINSIAGRVCPDKILDHTTGSPGTGCLYYDSGNNAQALDASSGALGTDYLTYWSNPASSGGVDAAFFEGNIATCNDKGMRLPVIYETGITSFPPSTWLPNSNPQFWDTSRDGVPSILGVSTWTASARRDPFEPGNTDEYFTWMERSYSTAVYYADGPTALPAVRCVLPAFY